LATVSPGQPAPEGQRQFVVVLSTHAQISRTISRGLSAKRAILLLFANQSPAEKIQHKDFLAVVFDWPEDFAERAFYYTTFMSALCPTRDLGWKRTQRERP
jgi:hypothetical protein